MRLLSVALMGSACVTALGISAPAYAADWRVCGTMVCEGNNGRCGLGRGEVDGAFVLQPLDADDPAVGGPEAAVEQLKQFTQANYGGTAPQLFLNTVCHARDSEEHAAAGYQEWTTKLDGIATNRRYMPVSAVFPGYAGGGSGKADQAEEQKEQASADSSQAEDSAEVAQANREAQNEIDASAEAEREQQRREEAKRAADQKAADAAARRKADADALEKRREEQRAELERIKAAAEKRGKASLDTDANTCVSNAELQLNASFQGNTAARVVNGCGVPVDIRVCLMTDGGWNCGVAWGVASQAGWSHSSFKATGRVFVDARVSGSSKPLAQPN